MAQIELCYQLVHHHFPWMKQLDKPCPGEQVKNT